MNSTIEKGKRTLTPLGNGLNLERLASGKEQYIWRGRVKGPDGWHNVRRTIGPVKDWTLQEAKREAKKLAGAPPEPSAVAAIPARTGVTVKRAWFAYMKADGDHKKTSGEKQAFFDRHVDPAIGEREFASVTRKDVFAILQRHNAALLAAGRKGVGTNRVARHLTKFWRWCARDGRDMLDLPEEWINPMPDLKVNWANETPRDRVLSEQELVWFFRAAAELPNTAAGREAAATRESLAWAARATEALLRCLCRRADMFNAEAAWIDGDKMLVPVTKKGRAFMVYLAEPVRALMGAGEGRVWPYGLDHLSHGLEAVRAHMNVVARREGFNGDFTAEFIDGEANPHYWRAHDFRTCGNSKLASVLDETDRQLFPPYVRSAVLNHVDVSTRGRHYEVYDHFAEKKAALTWWNQYLDGVKAAALQERALAA